MLSILDHLRNHQYHEPPKRYPARCKFASQREKTHVSLSLEVLEEHVDRYVTRRGSCQVHMPVGSCGLWELKPHDLRINDLAFLKAGTSTDAHSLFFNLTINSQPRPGLPWGEAQGSVDGKPFLWYDCDSNKGTPLGPLGEKVKASRTWTQVTQTLSEVGRELRMALSRITLDQSMTRGPRILQATLSCQCEAQRGTGACWEFSLNGQTTLLFDAMNGKWSAMGPGASGVKDELENNSDYFRRISTGDCSQWLGEFLPHWEGMLEPTGN
ncbi:PREDICTED: NKG2D ligand 4-like [Condylura cristata]|uniref:NKG2D ligand 4-like n=1 Tax=Condylura cristata TaxID=143302 RepID=UPI000643C948|nr:PREDICTED: NKG2D ligand 4-like [Condylura cristata]